MTQVSNQVSFLRSIIDQQPKYFCYLYMKSNIQAYIGFVFFLLGFFCFVKAIRQYRSTYKKQVLSGLIKILYTTIFIWLFLYHIKIIFSQIFYWLEINQHLNYHSPHQLSKISRIAFSVWFIATLIMQFILIFVPYNWMKSIIQCYNIFQSGDTMASQITIDKNRTYPQFQTNCRKILKYYMRFRLFYILLVVPLLIVSQLQVQMILSNIIICLMSLQTSLILFILILGLASIKRNKKLSQIFNRSQINTLVNQYTIIICSVTLKLTIQTIFSVNYFNKLRSSNCLNPQYGVQRLIIFIMQGLFTHLLPIFVVLRIYQIKNCQILPSDSLLVAQRNYSRASIDLIPRSDSMNIIQ